IKPMISGCGGRVPGEENRRGLQDRVVLLESADLGLERLDLSQLLAGRAGPLAAVDLGLEPPAAHGLPTDAELLAYRRRSGRELWPPALHRSSWAWCSSSWTQTGAASNLGRFTEIRSGCGEGSMKASG